MMPVVVLNPSLSVWTADGLAGNAPITPVCAGADGELAVAPVVVLVPPAAVDDVPALAPGVLFVVGLVVVAALPLVVPWAELGEAVEDVVLDEDVGDDVDVVGDDVTPPVDVDTEVDDGGVAELVPRVSLTWVGCCSLSFAMPNAGMAAIRHSESVKAIVFRMMSPVNEPADADRGRTVGKEFVLREEEGARSVP